MGKIVVGGVLVALALLCAVGGSSAGALFFFAAGILPLVKGLRERAAIIEAGKRAKEEANRVAATAAQAQADEKERLIADTAATTKRLEDYANEQRASDDLAGRDNLRRLVNDLVGYSNSLRVGADNASTVEGMDDTLNLLAGDRTILDAHKVDSNLVEDVRMVLARLERVGLADDLVSQRIKRYLLPATSLSLVA